MGQNKNDLSSIQEQSTSVFVHIINLLIYSIIADKESFPSHMLFIIPKWLLFVKLDLFLVMEINFV